MVWSARDLQSTLRHIFLELYRSQFCCVCVSARCRRLPQPLSRMQGPGRELCLLDIGPLLSGTSFLEVKWILALRFHVQGTNSVPLLFDFRTLPLAPRSFW